MYENFDQSGRWQMIGFHKGQLSILGCTEGPNMMKTGDELKLTIRPSISPFFPLMRTTAEVTGGRLVGVNVPHRQKFDDVLAK